MIGAGAGAGFASVLARRPLTVQTLPAALPSVSAAPSAAWGFRRLVSGYSGPLFRVVRASDGATLDVSAAASGEPELAAFDTFTAATTTKVSIVYDQVGANNLTQTADANRPIFTRDDAIRGKPGATMNGDGWLSVPAALTGSGQSMTTLDVAFATCGNNGGGYAQLGAGWNDNGSACILLGNGGGADTQWRMLNKSFQYTNIMALDSPQALVSVHSAASNIVHSNERTASVAATSAGTWAGGFIGRNSVPYSFIGQFFARVIYPAALAAGDVQLLKDAIYPMYDIEKAPSAQLLMPGNSIVQGTKALRNLWNNPRQAQMHFSQRVDVINAGRFGETAQTQYNNRGFYYDARRVGMRNFLHVPEPTNDIEFSVTAATAWNSYVKPFIDEAVVAGWTAADILVPTVLPRNFSGDATAKTAERNAYNALVRDNAAASGYAVVDYDAIPAMASGGGQYDDGTHPNGKVSPPLEAAGNGYGYMAKLLSDTINARLSA